MGTGSSKNHAPQGDAVKQLDSETDDFSPPPTFSRTKNPILHSANQLPKLPHTFEASIKDVQRKIVGLDDSDDEDNNISGKKLNGRNISDDKKLEKKLKRDIVDLENTLSDLEASDGMVRNGANFDRPYGKLVSQASIDIRDNDHTYFDDTQTSGSRRLPATSNRRASYGIGAKGMRQYPRQYNVSSNRHVSSIKFSWQEDSTTPNKDNEEEWTYKQVRSTLISK